MRFEGQLKSWNSERGFGFIEPAGGGQEIFLHVSAVPTSLRPPRVGQEFTFEVALNREGKKRAANVGIAVASEVGPVGRHGTVEHGQRLSNPCVCRRLRRRCGHAKRVHLVCSRIHRIQCRDLPRIRTRQVRRCRRALALVGAVTSTSRPRRWLARRTRRSAASSAQVEQGLVPQRLLGCRSRQRLCVRRFPRLLSCAAASVKARPNPSIERTSSSRLRLLAAVAHVER